MIVSINPDTFCHYRVWTSDRCLTSIKIWENDARQLLREIYNGANRNGCGVFWCDH